MNKDNLFDGESARAQFASCVYKRLMSRDWITYTDVMADRMSKSIDKLPTTVSNCSEYGELRKAFRDVYNAIVHEVGEGYI